MSMLKTILLAGLVSLPLTVAAHAADADAYVPSEASTVTGFYLRGDAGASFLKWSGGNNDTSWVAGGGIGWVLDKWLNTFPALFIVFFLLGSAAGILNIVRQAQRETTPPAPSVKDDEDDDK